MVNVVDKTNKNRNLLKILVFIYNTYHFSNDVIFMSKNVENSSSYNTRLTRFRKLTITKKISSNK